MRLALPVCVDAGSLSACRGNVSGKTSAEVGRGKKEFARKPVRNTRTRACQGKKKDSITETDMVRGEGSGAQETRGKGVYIRLPFPLPFPLPPSLLIPLRVFSFFFCSFPSASGLPLLLLRKSMTQAKHAQQRWSWQLRCEEAGGERRGIL